MLRSFPLDELVNFIDWTPFFKAWDLAGKFPDILTDEIVGEEASKLLTNKKEYQKMSKATNPFGDGKASERIVNYCIKFLEKNDRVT